MVLVEQLIRSKLPKICILVIFCKSLNEIKIEDFGCEAVIVFAQGTMRRVFGLLCFQILFHQNVISRMAMVTLEVQIPSAKIDFAFLMEEGGAEAQLLWDQNHCHHNLENPIIMFMDIQDIK